MWSSGRVGWQGRHELAKSERVCGSRVSDKVTTECGEAQVLRSVGAM